uniref:GCK domain-containing protein n=1 Tax=Kalanchoe fedtschenkoi TaxID=63787 RepID=A0A7N0V7T0_KALFE
MSTSSSEPQIDESTLESSKSTTDVKSEDPNPASGEETETGDGREEEEEEEEGECGFCLFMKGGGCKESFVAWEKCVEEAEERKEDVVSKCVEATVMLKKCMEAHSEYYEPVLRAERVAEEEAVELLQEEAVGPAMERERKLKEAESGAESGSGSSE